MRARTLLSALLLASAVAGCGRRAVTDPETPGGARRTESSTSGETTTGTTVQSGYLGSGNRTDSTSTEPITTTTTPP